MGASLRADGVMYDPARRPWRPTAARAILFPSFLSLSAQDAGGTIYARAAQSALFLLSLVMLWALGVELQGWTAGLTAVLLAVLNQALARAPGSLYIESFYAFVVLFVAWQAVSWARVMDRRSGVRLGLAIGVSLLCRSTLFALPVLLAAWTLRRRGRGGFRAAAALLLCAYLPLVPWLVRNYREFREFVPFERSAASFVLYGASVGRVDYDGGNSWAYEDSGVLKEGLGNPDQIDRRLLAVSLENIRRRPLSYARGLLIRFGSIWSRIARMSSWPIVLLAALAAFLRRRDPAYGALALLIAYFCAAHAFLAINDRFFLPLLMPLLALTAGGAALLAGRARLATADPERPGRLAAGTFAIAGTLLAGLSLLSTGFLLHEMLVLPEGSGLLGARGEFLAGAGRYDHSIRSLNRGIADGREDSRIYQQRGMAYHLEGRMPDSLQDFERAVRLDPENIEAWMSLAAVHAERPGEPPVLPALRRALDAVSRAPACERAPLWARVYREKARVDLQKP